jgi:hypothetical protein
VQIKAQRLWLIIALLAFGLYAALVPYIYSRPRPPVSSEMEVAIPRFAQVLMAAGDRYLAADLAGFRALVAPTEKMDAENYRILAIVQSDIAWFNPAHEDNYYVAAAILPWAGEIDAAQYILQRASVARPFDWLPAFYYAFNAFHLLKKPQLGAEWLRIAASQATDENEKIQLQQVAALWTAKGEDIEVAIRLHRAMAKEARDRGFAGFLEKRALRLENFLLLKLAMARYVEVTGEKPIRLQQLLEHGLILSVPSDPFGMQYVIDGDGKPKAVPPDSSSQGKLK